MLPPNEGASEGVQGPHLGGLRMGGICLNAIFGLSGHRIELGMPSKIILVFPGHRGHMGLDAAGLVTIRPHFGTLVFSVPLKNTEHFLFGQRSVGLAWGPAVGPSFCAQVVFDACRHHVFY